MKKKNYLWKRFGATALSLATVVALAGCGGSDKGATSGGDAKNTIEITNVSYDPTRELYESYNEIFAKYWKEKNRAGGNCSAVPWRFRQAGPLCVRRK